MNDIKRKPVVNVGVVENNKGRLCPITKEALTLKDKENLIDEMIYRSILFSEEWEIDFDIRVEHQKKVRDLEKRIEKKIKAKDKPKRHSKTA